LKGTFEDVVSDCCTCRSCLTWGSWWIQWTDWVCWRWNLRAKWRSQNGTLTRPNWAAFWCRLALGYIEDL